MNTDAAILWLSLDCNPPIPMTQCELLNWVCISCLYIPVVSHQHSSPQIKVYSEFGGKPHTWDQSQKGSVNNEEIDDDNNWKGVIVFMGYSVKLHTFMRLSLTEYVFVSLSLSLVIAKFFPAVHNQIVSRATRLEHQSLYWELIFVYGLLFAGARAMAIFSQTFYIVDLQRYSSTIIVPSVVEVIVNVILFIGALIASLKTKSSIEIPFPRGMAKNSLNISFFWSCACCCNCSQ